MALRASVRISSSTFVVLKPVRMTSSSVASLVSSRQLRPIFSIYANELDSQSDGGALNVRGVLNFAMEEPPGGAAFLWLWVAREMFGYILTVRGSVSLKLRAVSAGRTISFSPV